MAGGCCGRSTSHSSSAGLPGSPRFTQTGVIELATLTGCEEIECLAPYSGKYRNDLAYLVAWNTEFERLFKGNDSRAAVAWANHLGQGVLTNHRVLLYELPERAVALLYAE